MCSAPNRNAPTVVSGLLASSHVSGGGTMPRWRAGGQARGGGNARLGRLAPGEGGELAAVLGEHGGHGLAAVEDHHAAVGDSALALHDDGAQQPGIAVDLAVALDVDQATPAEVRIDREVA